MKKKQELSASSAPKPAGKKSPALKKKSRTPKEDPALQRAKVLYEESYICSQAGDKEGMIKLLEEAYEACPIYAPVLMTLGTTRFLEGNPQSGRRLLRALIELPRETPELTDIVDEGGEFLIGMGRYSDGYRFYLRAARTFPDDAAFLSGLSCCAGYLKRWEEAIAAGEKALALEPDNQHFVNDLGSTYLQAKNLDKAQELLERAVAMKPKDRLARGNLKLCREVLEEKKQQA